MTAIHSDEFKRDAVRIAQTSGLTRRQVASDLGGGLSTLNKWVKIVSDEAGPPDPDQNLLRENERLRRENRILKEERELLKNRHGSQPACARYKHPEQGYRSALGVLSLERRFGRNRLEAACDRALIHNTVSYASVQSILVTGLDKAAAEPDPILPTPPHDNIRGPAYYQ